MLQPGCLCVKWNPVLGREKSLGIAEPCSLESHTEVMAREQLQVATARTSSWVESTGSQLLRAEEMLQKSEMGLNSFFSESFISPHFTEAL